MKRYLILIVLVLLLTSLVSCADKKEKIEKIIVKKEEATRVEAMLLKKIPFESYAEYPGVFKEWDDFTISSEFAGTIEYMPYNVSDFIKKGDTVIRINTSVLRAQIKQVKTAQNIAKVNFDRIQKLYKKNLTTKSQLDNVQFQVDNAAAQLEVLNTNLRKSVIRSPFNGYIIRKMKKKGELAAPGMPIVTVVKLDPLKFILPIPERDVYKLSRGNVINIELEANKQVFKGMVYRIGQESNRGSHTVNIEVEVKNIKGFDDEFVLKPGMLAKAFVPVIREEKGFVIRLDSILKTEQGTFVFIDNNGKAKRIEVNIISTSNNKALIKSNELKEGSKLITKGIFELINGSQIEIVKLDKNKYKKDFNTVQFMCNSAKDKTIGSINNTLNDIRSILLDENIEILDLYRDRAGFNLIYKGKLPEFLSKCVLKD